MNDTNQSFGLTDQIHRPVVEAPVLAVEPLTRSLLIADDGVE